MFPTPTCLGRMKELYFLISFCLFNESFVVIFCFLIVFVWKTFFRGGVGLLINEYNNCSMFGLDSVDRSFQNKQRLLKRQFMIRVKQVKQIVLSNPWKPFRTFSTQTPSGDWWNSGRIMVDIQLFVLNYIYTSFIWFVRFVVSQSHCLGCLRLCLSSLCHLNDSGVKQLWMICLGNCFHFWQLPAFWTCGGIS